MICDAHLDPWMMVIVDRRECLFGYSKHHSSLGGLSWLRSSPLVEGPRSDVAVTISGRRYQLGRILIPMEMTGEARVAHRRLVIDPDGVLEGAGDEKAWLTACKMGRWLDLAVPGMTDRKGVDEFVAVNGMGYRQARAAWMSTIVNGFGEGLQ